METRCRINAEEADANTEDTTDETFKVEDRAAVPEVVTASQDITGNEPVAAKQVPEGGWGWVCALACAGIAVLGTGFYASFSITLLALVERYQSSAALTAWVFSFFLVAITMTGREGHLDAHF